MRNEVLRLVLFSLSEDLPKHQMVFAKIVVLSIHHQSSEQTFRP